MVTEYQKIRNRINKVVIFLDDFMYNGYKDSAELTIKSKEVNLRLANNHAKNFIFRNDKCLHVEKTLRCFYKLLSQIKLNLDNKIEIPRSIKFRDLIFIYNSYYIDNYIYIELLERRNDRYLYKDLKKDFYFYFWLIEKDINNNLPIKILSLEESLIILESLINIIKMKDL